MAKATPAQVEAAYLEILGRPADPGGAGFYTGKDLDSVIADLQYAAATGVEDVAVNRQATFGPTQDLTSEIQNLMNQNVRTDAAPTVNRPAPQPAPLERNPFYPTYTVREDVNYDELFGAKPLDQGGTPPTPEAINKAFETFYNRPADVPGIQGYLASGKSMEQINADLAYQALYAPELNLASNVEYYEAPSQAQLGYIQSLGGGAPTAQREDTFTYVAPEPLTTEEVTSIYQNQFGYDPTPQDIDYWTQVYSMSPDVRYSANPKQQTINAILAGSGLPQYDYLKTGVDLTGTQGLTYTGTPMNPAQLAERTTYTDYRTPPQQAAAPFGGFFGDTNFNPFDYTGIAPTPLAYTGYDPTAVQYQSELANQYSVPTVPPPVSEAVGDEGIAAALPT